MTRLEANLPHGYDVRTLGRAVGRGHALACERGRPDRSVAAGRPSRRGRQQPGGGEGTLRLNLPPGWTATPASRDLNFTRPGERAQFRFSIAAGSTGTRSYPVAAVAAVGGREFSEGYTVTRYRDLESRYLYRNAAATVTGVDAKVPSGLKIGYVMGIGDEVPAGLEQLGADVQLLGERDLAAAALVFNAIITGTMPTRCARI